MEVSLLLRLIPAVAVGTLVVWRGGQPWDRRLGQAADEVLRGLIVGLVAGRIAWLVLEGSWRTVTATFLLVRAGVVTWAGVLVAIAWVTWRADEQQRPWLTVAAPAAGLAGVATWHAACGVEAVCAGRPASWGLALPGYVSRVVPLGYLLAAVALLLAVAAWRWRCRPAVAVGAVAGYAVVRSAAGYLGPALGGYPTSDQVWGAAAAAVLLVLAVRVRKERPCPA